jgi:hypothetical protein
MGNVITKRSEQMGRLLPPRHLLTGFYIYIVTDLQGIPRKVVVASLGAGRIRGIMANIFAKSSLILLA